jgi:Domain of unknown function (DUF4864)
MRKALAGLIPLLGLIVVFSTRPAGAEDYGPQARALIERQLDAFARGDAAGAYELAAPGIKSIFTDSTIFMQMVRTQYAPVYSHRSAEFGAFSVDGDNASQDLTIIDDNNEVWTAIYKLARQPDGSWLINGCLLIKSDAKGASRKTVTT